jgi:hypothetical protein
VVEADLPEVVVMIGSVEMTTTSLRSKQELLAKLVDEVLLPRNENPPPTSLMLSASWKEDAA